MTGPSSPCGAGPHFGGRPGTHGGGQRGTRIRKSFGMGRGASRGQSGGWGSPQEAVAGASAQVLLGQGPAASGWLFSPRFVTVILLPLLWRGVPEAQHSFRACPGPAGPRGGGRARSPGQCSLTAWRPWAWREPALPPAIRATLDTSHRVPGLL